LSRGNGIDDPEELQRLHPEPRLIETARSFFPVLLLVFLVRSFLFEPFQIPSGSMKPTLAVGNFVLVSKFSYGLRLPVIRTSLWKRPGPERGDVTVFRFPESPKVHYIKRVIGLPGDRVVYRNKQLSINGEPASKTFVRKGADTLTSYSDFEQDLAGHQFLIREDDGQMQPGSEGEWMVPAGHYMVMGDNRDRSNDSRFWGFVPEDLVVGKATHVWLYWPSPWYANFPSFSNVGAIR
jgi:signal peptidase I